uniref:oleoyl-[acyl-carrier-protein] hydrolase n=1 Tax=Cyprinus carpio carpio TaxID=630221 RepID=A0A9J7Z2Z8_CYPCA
MNYKKGMDKVITCFNKRPDALVRLICFPRAGGGSVHYARWAKTLNNSFEGREGRAKEPFYQNMQEIVYEPFALFGHSFGAMTCFAFAEHVKNVYNLEPIHMFLSGASAPYSEARLQAPRRIHLSDQEFLVWVTSVGGTPPEILASAEFAKLFLPALKAVICVAENYRRSRPSTPILSYAPHDLQVICATVQMLPGTHFYLKEDANEKYILDYITKHLEMAEMDYL